MNKLFYKNKGFSLLEGIVIFIIGGLLITTVVGAYVQYLKGNKRQQRFIQVERELFSLKKSLSQSLTTLPGRGLATTNGLASGTPILPAAGALQDQTGKLIPIKLGIVTPYKINGQDAFTVAYADVKTPRLPISEPTTTSGTTGKARVSFIATQSNFMITKNPSSATQSVKGTESTPSPSPTPSSSPTPTGDSTPSPASNVNPPSIPLDKTLLDLPWKATPDMFKPGDVLLIVNTPIPTTASQSQQQVQTSSRLVKIINVIGTNNSKGELQSIDFTFDLCTTGECGVAFPGLINPPDAETKFLAGAILVPLKLATFYYKSDKMSNRLVRNDGGVVLPDGENNFKIQGGVEGIIGETDTFTVFYRLKDGSIQPTPTSPLVAWLSDVVSVDVELFREIPAPQGNERISRKAKLTFPIAIRNLD